MLVKTTLLSLTSLAASITANPIFKLRQDVPTPTSGNGTAYQNTTMAWRFSDIKPSKDINWQPCFGSYKCMYLTVPLDYEDLGKGYTSIAYIKYESKNGTGQDIIYNPGGPGGSGVSSLMSVKDSLVKSFGTDYNFVSFDPRGVNNTKPLKLSCGLQETSPPSAPIGEQWAQAKANSLFCNKFNANTTAKYAGTVANVQDMIHFTRLQEKVNVTNAGRVKIWYYGLSYGTVIGQTLASMYPQHVGRMILDSNVDGTEHYTGFAPSAVLDTDKTFHFFFEYCYQAGPALCPLARNATCASEVQKRYDAMLQKLESQPYIKPNSTDIITRDEAERLVFHAMYDPKSGFNAIAKQIANLAMGDSNKVNDVKQVLSKITNHHVAQGAVPKIDNVLQLISCIDTGDNYAMKTLDNFKAGVALIRNSSRYIPRAYPFANPLMCNGMRIVPPKSQLFPGFKKTNTSAPILFINNLGDPITPMASAKKMSGYFQSARVLAVNGPGHSYRVLGSKCADQHARAYLKTGILPEEGTVCEVDLTPKEVFAWGSKTFSTT